MNIIADTNILARAVLDDDALQSRAARKLLADADVIVVPLVSLCELVWLMSQSYRLKPKHVANSINLLLASEVVVCDHQAAEAGLLMMEAGGDFADGIIALEGRRLGGHVFTTFDRKAAALVQRGGHKSLLVAVD